MEGIEAVRRASRFARVLAVLVVTSSVSACGGSDASEDRAQAVGATRLARADIPRLQAMAPDPPPYRGLSFERGSARERAKLMSIFREMQRDFYSGDAKALCQRFGTSLDSLPELEASDGRKRIEECAGIVSRTAKKLVDGAVRWPPHRVSWVRIYDDPGVPTFGGVTAESDGNHPKIRVGFVKRGGRWYADFRIPDELPAMNAN